MTDENTTVNQSNTNTTPLPDPFFDPAWQLAITVEFYFKYAVLAIGIFGTAANGLVLYALISHNIQDAKKRAVNLLIINQNVMDLSCCVLLVFSVCIQINDIYLTGALGYLLCALVMSDTASYCVLYGSVINLVALTGERYLKVVHPFWSKKKLKRWMVQAAIAVAWIGGILYTVAPSIASARVENGFCVAFDFQSTQSAVYTYGGFHLAVFFIFPLIEFIYCYGRILMVMRRQARVMAEHNVEGSAQTNAPQSQSRRVKWNIIKTMLVVSVTFVICWSPKVKAHQEALPNVWTYSIFHYFCNG